jgi:hypothetical protein
MVPDVPEDLIGQRIDFYVEIKKAYELPEDFCKDIYCKYQIYINEEDFSTERAEGKNQSPEFNYRFLHTNETVTEHYVKYLKDDSLCIKVYGFPDIKQKIETSSGVKKS